MPLIPNWPYKVRIFQKKGDKTKVIEDRGRMVKMKDGNDFLRLKMMKEDIAWPEFENMYFDSKGHNMIDLWSPTSGEYYPMTMNESEVIDKKGKKVKVMKKQPIEKDVLFWWINNYQRTQKKYQKEQDKWSKLLPVILNGLFIAGIAVSLIFLGDIFVQVGASMNAALSTFERTSQNFDSFGVALDRMTDVLEDKQDISQVVQVPNTPPIG